MAGQVIMAKAPRKRQVRFVPDPVPGFWADVHLAAQAYHAPMQRAFVATFEEARGALPVDKLAGLLATGHLTAALALFEGGLVKAAYERRVLPLEYTIMAAGARAAVQTVPGAELLKKQGMMDWGPFVHQAQAQAPPPTFSITSWFDLTNPEAIRAAAANAAVMVTRVTRGTMLALRAIVEEAQRQGISIPEQARRIARQLNNAVGLTAPQARTLARLEAGWREAGLGETKIGQMLKQQRGRMIKQRSLVIARHETMEAASAGVDELWGAAEKEGLLPKGVERKWLTQPSLNENNPCKICRPMNGQRKKRGEYFVSPYNGARALRNPIHVQCLPGDTLVSPRGRVTAASKRWFDGDLVIIEVADNLPLSCTPNHPILTGRGWVAASLLKVGDEVIGSFGREGVGGGDGQDIDRPARIEDIAEAFFRDSQVVTTPVPVAAEDFHGDGMQGDIAIVGTDGLLLDHTRQPSGPQRLQHGNLLGGDVGEIALAGPSAFGLRVEGLGFAPAGLVGRAGHGHPMLSGRVPVSLKLGGRAVAGDYPSAEQHPSDGSAGYVEMLGEGQLRDPSTIEADDLIGRQITALRHEPYSGLVYNLETTEHIYTAHSIVCHNCMCVVTLVLDTVKQ